MTFRKLVHLVHENNLDPTHAYTAKELSEQGFMAPIMTASSNVAVLLVTQDTSEVGGSVAAPMPEELSSVEPPAPAAIRNALKELEQEEQEVAVAQEPVKKLPFGGKPGRKKTTTVAVVDDEEQVKTEVQHAAKNMDAT